MATETHAQADGRDRAPSTPVEPPRRRESGSYLDDLDRYWKLAKVLTQSGLLPSGLSRPAQAMAVMLKGRELGIAPMQAFSQIHVIDGRPVMSGSLLMALCVRDAGCVFTALRQEVDGAAVRIERPGWEPYEAEFTEEDARRAGLLEKEMWQAYPKAMYWWRAVSIACRTVCPDVVGGLYTPEEIADEVEIDPETGGLKGRGEGPSREGASRLRSLEARYRTVWKDLVPSEEDRDEMVGAYQRFHPRLGEDREAWSRREYAVAIRDLERRGEGILERIRERLG